MLRGKSYIARSGVYQQIRPTIRIEQFRPKHRREVEIWEVRPVGPFVKCPGGGSVFIGPFGFHSICQGVPIPFGVRCLIFGMYWRERGNGVNAPMYKDAELRIGVPARSGP